MGEEGLRDPSLMRKEEDLGVSQAKGREKRVPDGSNSWGGGQEVRENLVHLEN